MAKFHHTKNGNYAFWCPGCNEAHYVSTNAAHARRNRDGSRPWWKFNGDVDAPTLEPSMRYGRGCHFYITEGKIAFQGDCTHALAGQTVPLPDWKERP